MLHCGSCANANVVRPLAFDAGVLPDSATGVGVAQIHGVVCEPSSTGPPIGWLVILRRACGSLCPRPSASATNSLSPSTRSVTTPRRVRAAALVLNAPVTARPLSRKVTWFSGTFFGTRTSSSASPPLTRSARFDSDTISKLDGSSPAWAVTRRTAPSAKNDDFTQFMVSSSLGGTLRQRLLHPLRRERQRAQSFSRGVGDGVGDRRGGRPLRAFAHAVKAILRVVEQHDLDLRHVLEADDRVVRPALYPTAPMRSALLVFKASAPSPRRASAKQTIAQNNGYS